MKELSIEEKAARYDDAIKRVENIKTGKCETTFMFTEGLFEHIFPELAESKDEKIRKSIYNCVEWFGFDSFVFKDVSQEECLAWIGKQGSQNLANSAKTCKDEHKQAWSEEDEECADLILRELKQDKENSPEYRRHFERLIDWFATRFISIISQTTWKPSEEQLEALHYVTNFDYGGHKATLVSLYEQLKKLKG